MVDLFYTLDRDKDGVISALDFSSDIHQFLNIYDAIDPHLLYGDKTQKARYNPSVLTTPTRRQSSGSNSHSNSRSIVPFGSPTSLLLSHSHSHSYSNNRNYYTPLTRENSMANQATPQGLDETFRGPYGDETLELNTAISLQKSDSLRYSLSHEKSFPLPTPSRSFSGLDETEAEVNALIERTCDILDDSESNVTAMLWYYKWDCKRLVEDYIENSRAVRLAVGLGPRTKPPFYRYDFYLEEHCAKDDETSSVQCGICQDTVELREAFALHCCHWYCVTCWQGYIETAIHGRNIWQHCPAPDCKYLVVPVMHSYFADADVVATAKKLVVKYVCPLQLSSVTLFVVDPMNCDVADFDVVFCQTFQIIYLSSTDRSFVEEKRGKKVVGAYCKNPRGCKGVVVMAEDADSSEAVCSLCATSFCAACDMPPHAPATCEMVAAWEEKGGYLETGKAEDVEARKLKHLTTKPCPRCGVRIEKNGGCPVRSSTILLLCLGFEHVFSLDFTSMFNVCFFFLCVFSCST